MEIAESLSAEFTHVLLETFHLAFGEDVVAVGHLEGFDAVLFGRFGDGGEDLVVAAFEDIDHVDHLHTETQIGFVAAVFFHRFAIRHTRKRSGDFDTAFGENRMDELFRRFDHVVLGTKTHLHVDLGEFGLSVGAQVLVAEAFGDLEIAIESAHHQKLFKELRRLRQGVKLAGMYAAGDEIVSGAFGGRFGQYGGFDFQKPHLVQCVSGGDGGFGA